MIVKKPAMRVFFCYTKKMRLLASGVLFAYLVIGVFGFAIPMNHGAHHHGASNCPFMQNEFSICSMTFLDHINTWKSMFTFDLFNLLVVISGAVFFIIVLYEKQPYLKRRRESMPTFLELMYSNGILNPKLF